MNIFWTFFLINIGSEKVNLEKIQNLVKEKELNRTKVILKEQYYLHKKATK